MVASRKAAKSKPKPKTKKKPPARPAARSVEDPPDTPETRALVAISSEPARELAKSGEGVVAYPGASIRAFKKDERKGLSRDFTDEEIEIMPDGVVYLPSVRFRDRLDEVFGQGRHSLVRQTKWEIVHSCAMATFHLYVDARFIQEATGSMRYHPDNKRMDYGDAIEGATSNALMRCCKKLGVGTKLWDPQFRRAWRTRMATRFWCKKKNANETKPMWFRNDDIDGPAYPWEITGEAPMIAHPKPTGPKPGKAPARTNVRPVTPPPPPKESSKKKKDDTPAPPSEQHGMDESPASCSITSMMPPLKQGADTVYRYMIQDETGAKWWGATKNPDVADVLTSCFSGGGDVELTSRVLENSQTREIVSASPVMP